VNVHVQFQAQAKNVDVKGNEGLPAEIYATLYRCSVKREDKNEWITTEQWKTSTSKKELVLQSPGLDFREGIQRVAYAGTMNSDSHNEKDLDKLKKRIRFTKKTYHGTTARATAKWLTDNVDANKHDEFINSFNGDY